MAACQVEGIGVGNLPYAKSVCLPSCPSSVDLCNAVSHLSGSDVCDAGSQFRCPYYALQTERVPELGHYDLYHNLPGLSGIGTPQVQTQYYDSLAATNQTECLLEEADSVSLLPGTWDASLLTGMSAEQQCGQYYQAMSKVPNTGPCFPVFSQTVDYLNRCIPDTSDIVDIVLKATDPNSTVSKALDQPYAVLQRYAMDLYKGISIVLVCGLLLGCVFALFWMTVLRYFAGIMAWAAVILVNLMFAAICVLCFQRAGLLGQAGAMGQVGLSPSLDSIQQTPPPPPSPWSYLTGYPSGVPSPSTLCLSLSVSVSPPPTPSLTPCTLALSLSLSLPPPPLGTLALPPSLSLSLSLSPSLPPSLCTARLSWLCVSSSVSLSFSPAVLAGRDTTNHLCMPHCHPLSSFIVSCAVLF